ncbi:endonuclease domain-containing protein [Thermomonospora umbrina]|uniref:endonuclease domain-containing protein n=1 Tax=Thermomonospora umbrina TaxID=111806 RepID=UPI001B87C443|nr:endonuclease domain-containing protein [Thermomonospora umbrina]
MTSPKPNSIAPRMLLASQPPTAEEAEEARRTYWNRDPACWSWAAPETRTYKDEDSAGLFLSWWNRECAVCGVPGRLVVDHDHKTGLIRGRLCGSCNSLEGHASDDYGVFRKYRERPPAVILGIRAQYYNPWTGYAEPEPELSDEAAAEQRAARKAAVERLAHRLPSPEDLHGDDSTRLTSDVPE